MDCLGDDLCVRVVLDLAMNTVLRTSAWMERYAWIPWAMMGLALLYVGITPFMPLYDILRPVVTMSASIVARDADSITVNLAGEKHRNCRYAGIGAAIKVGDVYVGTQIQRIDMPAKGVSQPVGRNDFGTWRVWPLKDGTLVTIHIQYACDARYVLAKVAEVKL